MDPRLVLISIRTWFDKFDFLVRPTAQAISDFAKSPGINALASPEHEREKQRELLERVAAGLSRQRLRLSAMIVLEAGMSVASR